MAISIQKTSIEGLTLIHPHVFEDQRGYFIKDFEKSVYEQNDLPILFYECNESKSKKGTIRGLHFQQKFSQGKLIRVTKGAVFDVAVDLRFDSTTFGKWEGFILSEFNHDVLYIPEGFAHGFVVLTDEAEFAYKCTDFYHPGDEGGVLWSDPEIGIDWPIPEGVEPILSEKDKKWLGLKDTFHFE